MRQIIPQTGAHSPVYGNSTAPFGGLRLPPDLGQEPARRRFLADLRRTAWVVYAKRPFAGPQAVPQYLGRYTHRIAISNNRLVSFDGRDVRFRWRD